MLYFGEIDAVHWKRYESNKLDRKMTIRIKIIFSNHSTIQITE